MDTNRPVYCPECDDSITRREFLRAAGAAVVAAGAAVAAAPAAAAALPIQKTPAATKAAPETLVKTLYESLGPRQRDIVALPWDSPRRKMISANWAIVDPTIADVFNADQQEMIRLIVKGASNEEWFPKLLAQMKNDGGGIENYHVALFGRPAEKLEWVLTGRHTTIRVGGDKAERTAFGGPIFYGHAIQFDEQAGHPGNLFWYQARRANEVFQMLDGKQRGQALLGQAPEESAISFRKDGETLPGIPVASLSRDQKHHVQQVMQDVLAPFRKPDVDEVLADIKSSGGLDAVHLAFYKQEDLGNDGIWDIWRLEGPSLVWHFRGAPHVHTWVHVARKP